MSSIILASFSKFGSYRANSSELVARAVALKIKYLAGYNVLLETFPANIPCFNRGEALLGIAKYENAIAIIALGMSSSAKGLCVETQAVNMIDNEKYCPEWHGLPVDSGLPLNKVLHSDLKPWNITVAMAKAKSEDIDITLSSDPGRFCCNHLMFQTLHAQKRSSVHSDIPFLFVHIPCSPEAIPEPRHQFDQEGKVTLEIKTIIRGIELILLSAKLPK